MGKRHLGEAERERESINSVTSLSLSLSVSLYIYPIYTTGLLYIYARVCVYNESVDDVFISIIFVVAFNIRKNLFIIIYYLKNKTKQKR